MKICFFGSYDPYYSRNKILIDGLQKNGAVIFHCLSLKDNFILRYGELIKRFWSIQKKVDILFVAFVGQLNMPLAWFLGKITGIPVIFDMFYSMYDTYTFDRQSVKPLSLKAVFYYSIDKLSAILANIVLVDTYANRDYFCQLFSINKSKFVRIFVGGDDTLFIPPKRTKKGKVITIEFHGMFSRLSGAEYYIEAAKLLENEKYMSFLLIGNSGYYKKPIQLFHKLEPKNMKYLGQLPLKRLAQIVRTSDITIGHLGITQKAKNVISNKIFQGIACGNAVITSDTPAIHELLTKNQNVLLCESGSATDLARKIRLLVSQVKLRSRIAHNGYNLSERMLSNKYLGKQVLSICQKLIEN